jgi:glucose-1-phosphate cytidylyltransferase
LKVAILAGGEGTRLAEETEARPKPLIEIGGRPILWHIMMHYAHHGFEEFVIALGYRGEQVKRFFSDYSVTQGSVTVDFRSREIRPLAPEAQQVNWVVDLVDTGDRTGSGGRMRRIAPFLPNETFMMTYCDGVSDVDLKALLAFHKSHGRLATLTAVQPRGRYGRLGLDGDRVVDFTEKPLSNLEWINGGFFVLEPGVMNYIVDDDSDWAGEVLPRLSEAEQLMAYRHESFWQCMDTLHERTLLQSLWTEGSAPWKTWAQ